MRWSTVYHLAIATGALVSTRSSTTEAFAWTPLPVVPSTSTTMTQRRMVGGLGWDNESYMEALGNGSNALNEANEEYYAKSRFGKTPEKKEEPATDTPDAQLSKDDIEKIKQRNSEVEGQGGKLFQQLLQRAQQASPPPAYYAPPPAMPPRSPPTTDLSQLSVEEQARLFREMMAQQQRPAATPVPPAYTAASSLDDEAPTMPYTPAPPQTMVGGLDSKGRKIGRNRDADAINNTSDLYFAQLKRDSTVRNMARYMGDDEKANQVFTDPTVQELKLTINPYLEEQKKKEKEMLDTSEDESLIPIVQLQQLAEEQRPKTNKGPSYKERLQQRQNGGIAPAATAVSPAPAMPAPATAAVPPPPAPETAALSPAPIMPTAPEAAPVVQSMTVASTFEDEMRRDIRRLMGLLLKHRGGPGFGKGRLQGAEAEELETLATEITGLLRSEAVQAPPSPVMSSSSAPVVSAPTASAPTASAPSTASPQEGKVGNVIACIEGAITMYKNSPEELQESILITLRAALLSAVSTLNDVMGDQAPISTPSSSRPGQQGSMNTKVNSLINVIEGAIVMYKNSPPELQDSVLVALRAALLSAVNTLNGIIASNEEANVSSYQSSIQTIPKEQAPVQSTPPGDDANSELLRQIYSKLEQAAGSGKMGLRDDLTAEEATELADSIAEMRAILVDELTSGIPSTPTSYDASTVTVAKEKGPNQSSVSKYQEMLNKAKAEKGKTN